MEGIVIVHASPVVAAELDVALGGVQVYEQGKHLLTDYTIVDQVLEDAIITRQQAQISARILVSDCRRDFINLKDVSVDDRLLLVLEEYVHLVLRPHAGDVGRPDGFVFVLDEVWNQVLTFVVVAHNVGRIKVIVVGDVAPLLPALLAFVGHDVRLREISVQVHDHVFFRLPDLELHVHVLASCGQLGVKDGPALLGPRIGGGRRYQDRE